MPNVAQRFLNAIKRFVARIKRAFGKSDSASELERAAELWEASLYRIRRNVDKQRAREEKKAAKAEKKAAEEDNTVIDARINKNADLDIGETDTEVDALGIYDEEYEGDDVSYDEDPAQDYYDGPGVDDGTGFEDVSEDDDAGDDGDGGSAYFIEDIDDEAVNTLRSIGEKSVNEFASEELKKAEPFARKLWKELGVKSPFFRAWFGDWRANDASKVSITEVETINIDDAVMANGDYKIEDTGWTIHAGKTLREETKHYAREKKISVRALSTIEQILNNSVLLDTEVSVPDSKNKSDGTALMHKLYTIIQYDGKLYIAKTTVEEYLDTNSKTIKRKGYHLRAIKIETAGGRATEETSASTSRPDTVSINSISDLFNLVKTYDKEFNPKPASKIVNEDGTPKVMYHGSNAKFTVFDKRKAKSSGYYGRGFYFSDSNNQAGLYGEQYSVYLDVKNPLKPGGNKISGAQLHNFLKAVAENEDYSIENYGTYDIAKIANSITSTDTFAVISDINATAIGDFVEAVKLFNEVNGTKYDGIVVPTETVVFESTQIKSATDNIGTFNKNDPDIMMFIEDVEDVGAYVTSSELEANAKKHINARASNEITDMGIRKMARETKIPEADLQNLRRIYRRCRLNKGDSEEFNRLISIARGLATTSLMRHSGSDKVYYNGVSEKIVDTVANELIRMIADDTYTTPDDVKAELERAAELWEASLYRIRRNVDKQRAHSEKQAAKAEKNATEEDNTVIDARINKNADLDIGETDTEVDALGIYDEEYEGDDVSYDEDPAEDYYNGPKSEDDELENLSGNSDSENDGDGDNPSFIEDFDVDSPQIITNYSDAIDNILTVSDDDAKKYAENRTVVEVCANTPSVILDNVTEAKNLKIIINYTKLYLAVRKSGIIKGNYHNLGAEVAKNLHKYLENPDAIIRLDNGRLNVLFTVKTSNGNNGLISVELNSTKDVGGKNEKYNVIVTVMSSNNNYIKNLTSRPGVSVKYKREDLSQVNPQLYKWLATINDRTSPDNRIPQNNPTVNSNNMQSSQNYYDDDVAAEASARDAAFFIEDIEGDEGYVTSAELEANAKKHINARSSNEITDMGIRKMAREAKIRRIFRRIFACLIYSSMGSKTLT